jgi:CubicO group peptidase (beta-lactamase class C family)
VDNVVRRRRSAWVAAVFVGILVASAAASAASPSGVDVDHYLRSHGFVGTALVGRGNTVVLARGYGDADLARRIANTAHTQYRVTWLAGMLTDVAILQLVDAGRLRLDESICSTVPRCPVAWRGVTVKDLETYRVRFGVPSQRLDPGAPLARWIEAMRRMRPVPSPIGDRGGSALLAQYIVEKKSGLSWWRYVDARILRPARMTETRYDDLTRPGSRATPYDGTRPVRVRDAQLTPDRSDGVVSTVGDFFRFSRALDDGALLSTAMQREMSEFVPGSFVRGQYGVWRYGRLVTRMFGHLFQGQHAHGEPGWSTWFMRFPEDHLTVLLFQNKTQGSGDTANGLAALLLGCPGGSLPTPKPC